MTDRIIPEVTVGKGAWQLNLRGVEAINAAGWALKLILIAQAAGILTISVGVTYMLLQMPGTLSKSLPLAKWFG